MLDAITIDGPAASGKNTVGELVAERLGWHLLDTGAMYRAVTVAVLDRSAPPADWPAIAREVRVVVDGTGQRTLVGDDDVSPRLREPRVEALVSTVSADPDVRAALVARQRELARQGKLILVGRDTGTGVLPDARHKFYLDASARVRAQRRLAQHPAGRSLDQVEREIRERDRQDSQRTASPLRVPDDAVVIDTGPMTVEEVVEAIVRTVAAAQGR